MTAQRLRLWFRKGQRVRYISHLDVLRHWERVFRRAELPLAYTKGFTPHPRLAFAAPLPLGFIAEGDVFDATLDERVDLDAVRDRLAEQSTEDLSLVDMREVAAQAPAPQASLKWADYRFDISGATLDEARAAIDDFMARETFEWVDERREKKRTYDMRAGVASLSAEEGEEGVRIRGRLGAHQDLTIRPEELLKAILPDASASLFVRERLSLDEPSPAREAWRRRGQFEA